VDIQVYDDDSNENDDISSDEEDDASDAALVNRLAAPIHAKPATTFTEPPKSAFDGLTRKKGAAMKSELFDMGGWSDDDHGSEEIPSPSPSAGLLGAAGGDLARLLDARDEEDRERQQRMQGLREAEAAKKEQQRREKQHQQQTLAALKPKHARIVAHDHEPAVPAFRPFYLAWTDEPGAVDVDYSKELSMLERYYANIAPRASAGSADAPPPSGSSREEELEDEYEASGDKVFRRFTNRVQRHPEQCVRYWPNVPLRLHKLPKTEDARELIEQASKHPLDAYKDQSGMWGIHTAPACSGCGSPMRLEMQLMPNLLNELRVNDDDDAPMQNAMNKAMDWGVVDVYMCPLLCSPDEYVSGYACVQPSI
jgi:hypothetical protein